VAAVVELVVLEEGELGLDAFHYPGVVDRSAGEAFYLGGREQAAAAAPRAGAGEDAPTDVGVDRLRLDLQPTCDLRGRQVILVTFRRHPRSSSDSPRLTLTGSILTIVDWLSTLKICQQ
jgi:hypothetical protein